MEVNNTWQEILAKVASKEGETITHEYLKDLFMIERPSYEDFEDHTEFFKALDLYQFEYLTMMDKLKKGLLTDHQMCLKNVRGDGYIILKPEEQTTYAFDKLVDDIKKSIRNATLITSNVRSYNDISQRSKDNDLRSKIAIMKQVYQSIN